MTTRPWDGTGIDVMEHTQVTEALRQAGADFYVDVVPGYFGIKTPMTITIDDKSSEQEQTMYHAAEGYNYIIRTDTNQVLGTCRGRFVPLQNQVMVDIVQPLIDKGVARLDTIGVFGNGEKVWMLIELPSHTHEIVEGDKVTTYLLLVNGHDGSTSIMVGVVPFRVWCSNMFPRIGKHMIKFKHTENAEEMLAFFRLKITSVLKESEQYMQGLRTMAQCPVPSIDKLEEYFTTLFKIGESTKAKNKLAALLSTYEVEVQGTGHWYDAFNAVTQYLSFEAGRGEETRLNSLWFGANADISQKAYELALKESK